MLFVDDGVPHSVPERFCKPPQRCTRTLWSLHGHFVWHAYFANKYIRAPLAPPPTALQHADLLTV